MHNLHNSIHMHKSITIGNAEARGLGTPSPYRPSTHSYLPVDSPLLTLSSPSSTRLTPHGRVSFKLWCRTTLIFQLPIQYQALRLGEAGHSGCQISCGRQGL